jgi:hypothetical protein
MSHAARSSIGGTSAQLDGTAVGVALAADVLHPNAKAVADDPEQPLGLALERTVRRPDGAVGVPPEPLGHLLGKRGLQEAGRSQQVRQERKLARVVPSRRDWGPGARDWGSDAGPAQMRARPRRRKLAGMSSMISIFPPLVLLFGPWVLLALVLAGPFLLLLTAVVLALAAMAVPVLPVAAFLLLRRRRAQRVPVAAPRVAIELRRAAA